MTLVWFTAEDASGRSAPDGGAPPLVDPRLLDTPILIIEDEAVIAWTLESLFDDLGFTRIALAPDAAAAVAAARAQPPGLIISDINLGPGPDGVEAVAEITRVSPAPAIFVTGYASEAARLRIETAASGATVLRKPVQFDDLQRAVVRALGARTAH